MPLRGRAVVLGLSRRFMNHESRYKARLGEVPCLRLGLLLIDGACQPPAQPQQRLGTPRICSWTSLGLHRFMPVWVCGLTKAISS